ncbi:MAG: segregation/condensation protein A [Oscillospiraceae bacterium]|nr:segregation/condensation protein A [Oscillospiraceae bacterium]
MSEKLNYKLDAFEGPLDLLLFLIQKHKLNICDINISELLEQYTESIKDIENFDDMDGAAEFLEMAARLVYIKTAMLLPRYDDEGEKLRQELQGELIEYQACKKAAEYFRKRFCGNSIFSRKPMEIEADNTYARVHPSEDILKAYLSALGRKQRKLPPPVEAFSGVVHKKLISVPSRAIILLKRLYRRTKLKWNELFSGTSRSESVAMFLAVLELVKNGRINVSDDNETVVLNKDSRRKKQKEGDETAAGTV